MSPHSRDRLIRLGASRWHTRPKCALRSAGFPVTLVDRLCDAELAATTDACAEQPSGSAAFEDAYRHAGDRLAHAIRELAADPLLREAIAWQNTSVVRNCLDKILGGKPLPGRVWRQYVLTIASYVQRYAVKNDTIGFFGPLAWAEWSSEGPPITARPGKHLLSRRSLYFESWAIDAVARALSDDPEIFPWCVPRLAENLALLNRSLYSPRGSAIELGDSDLELLSRCDGKSTVREIAAGAEAVAHLRSLVGRGLVIADLAGPLEARPEITLRRTLDAIGDPEPRRRALTALDRLLAARDKVAAAAGDDAKLVTTLGDLGAAFEWITDVGATRRHGEMYAGRTVVYEDTQRDVGVRLGASLLDAIAEPLALVLESAQWLAGRAAELYSSRLAELYDRCAARTGSARVPLAMLVGVATPDLAYSAREVPPLAGTLIAEFQERWASVLRAPDGGNEHSVAAKEISARVRAAFPAVFPRWSAAVHHSPDIMIAAAPGDSGSKDFVVVLGEVHVATNTLRARPLIEIHHNPSELMAAEDGDHGRRRIFVVPSKDARYVNSRTYPPALLSPKYTYWTMHSNITGAPGPVLPVADLVVVRRDTGLEVRSRGAGTRFDILEVFGEYISGVIVNSFQPVPPAGHRPRISIDCMVIARESWTFRFGEMDWCTIKSEPSRYRKMRDWRRSHQIPERAFYRIAGEDKPIFCDFTSIPFVHLLARSVRKAAREDPDGSLTLTEMLPDKVQTWLRDAHGSAYTAELRMVFTDPATLPGPLRDHPS
jgi:hypothetical protein